MTDVIASEAKSIDVVFLEITKASCDQFFIGPLPNEGDAVELIFVGLNGAGGMRFQLRTKCAA